MSRAFSLLCVGGLYKGAEMLNRSVLKINTLFVK